MKAILEKTPSRRPSSYLRIPSLKCTDSVASQSQSNPMARFLPYTTTASSSTSSNVTYPLGSEYVLPLSREKTSRECKIENMSHAVFSEGSFYIKGAYELESLLEGTFSFPEIALIGKPNTGKSSIISALLHNRKIAKKNRNRGTTRILNFINVGDAFLLVDTPGYGTWDKMPDRRFKMCEAHGALFQYLAARSRGNLRHVYWVFEGTKKDGGSKHYRYSAKRAGNHWMPSEREKEMLRFLEYERIPFTAILNKADRYVDEGDFGRLADDVYRLYDFFGTDLVPVMHTIACRAPEKHRNIDLLQHDMMTHVCSQLPDEHLTIRHLKELSYIPLSTEEQIRIEERYPKTRCIIPDNDDISMKKFILDHERAKLNFIEYKRFDAIIQASMHKLEKGMKQTLINFPEYLETLSKDFEEDAAKWDIESDGLLRDIMIASNSPKKDIPALSSTSENELNSLPLWKDDIPSDDVNKLCISSNEGKEAPNGHVGKCGEETLANGSSPSTSTSLENTLHKNSLISGVKNVLYKPSILSYPQGVISPAFPQKFLPESLVNRDIAKRSVFMPRSFDAFKESCKDHPQNIERVYTEEGDTVKQFFEEKDVSEIEHLSQKSRMIRKYVVKKKKPRSLSPTSSQFMAPWLGMEKESRLLGIACDGGGAPRVTGGSILRRLKSTGFGGRSISPNTMKKRR